ncbi:MAG TPA: peptidoglycan-binding protein [Bacillota bacterium]|nr:peptidoglycan-binding protein [Bacillota bacterium]
MSYASRYLRLMDPLMEGIDVTNVQQRLTELGFYDGSINGIYDSDTIGAVRDFQLELGLVADGVVGPQTWNAIGLSAQSFELFDNQYTISIDIDELELILYEDDLLINDYPVAVGKPLTPTPIGTWRIIQKTENPGGPFGARWMRLSIPWGGYGIHGTDSPESIGTAASNGCIRMTNEDVIGLYDIVPLGTQVNITGTVSTGRVLFLGVEPGSDIRTVKDILQRLGYYSGPLDDQYTEATRDAVINFQEDYGLVADGIVGENTYQALQKMNAVVTGDREP